MGAMKGGSLADKGIVKGPENPHCSEVPLLLGGKMEGSQSRIEPQGTLALTEKQDNALWNTFFECPS